MILNLGCGDLPIKDAINVDVVKGKYVEVVCCLNKTPWQWSDNSVDGIYMIHSLEHFEDIYAVLKECHRILKKGGFLYVQVPHSSGCAGIGSLGHCRTFHYHALSDVLCRSSYLFTQALFKEKLAEIRWWNIPRNKKHPYIKFATEKKDSAYPKLYKLMIIPLSWLIQKLINISPVTFERFWCYWVGGADEVVWMGEKI